MSQNADRSTGTIDVEAGASNGGPSADASSNERAKIATAL
jgi:hypothetical protein